MAIRMLPAGHGDALVIEYGTRAKTRRLLVDAGTVHSWKAVKAQLLALPEQRFEAFVVTHVDEDHIGGALKLLEDEDLRHRIRDVWFNGYVHCDESFEDDVLGPIDGERLTTKIGRGGYRWNKPFAGGMADVGGPVVVSKPDELPVIDLAGGARIHLLSPTPAKLAKMAREWKKVVSAAGLTPGEGTPLEGRPPPRRDRVASPVPELDADWISEQSKPTTPDGSEANGSSIAFIFEYDDARILLAADAHSDVLVSSLRIYAKSLDVERVPLDLVKLPHHCSKGNVTTELVEVIDADRYLISTNGDNFGHPDREAIARIIRSSATPVRLYCNYRTAYTSEWEQRGPSVGATFTLPRSAAKPGLRIPAKV